MERLAQRNKIQAYNKAFFFIFFEQSAYRLDSSVAASVLQSHKSGFKKRLPYHIIHPNT